MRVQFAGWRWKISLRLGVHKPFQTCNDSLALVNDRSKAVRLSSPMFVMPMCVYFCLWWAYAFAVFSVIVLFWWLCILYVVSPACLKHLLLIKNVEKEQFPFEQNAPLPVLASGAYFAFLCVAAFWRWGKYNILIKKSQLDADQKYAECICESFL